MGVKEIKPVLFDKPESTEEDANCQSGQASPQKNKSSLQGGQLRCLRQGFRHNLTRKMDKGQGEYRASETAKYYNQGFRREGR